MIVYLVIVEDRHTDVEVSVFADREAAIRSAETAADENARRADWRTEIEQYEITGRLYFAQYSDEGDSVSVIEETVQ